MEIHDRPGVCLLVKVLMLKAEVLETILLYGWVPWSPKAADHDRLQHVHHTMFLRCLGWWKRKRGDHTLSYADVLVNTDSESIEATVRREVYCSRVSWHAWERRAHDVRGDGWGGRATPLDRRRIGWGSWR